MFGVDSSSGQPSLNPNSFSHDDSSREARVQKTFGEINFYSRKTSGPCVEDIMDDMSHTILYQSPLVDDPRKAPFVIIGEHHDLDSRIVNAPAVDELVEPDSILSVEGVSASTMEDHEPLKGIVRSKILSLYRISEYAESCLAVFGWDASNHMKEEIEEDEEGKRREGGEIVPLNDLLHLVMDLEHHMERKDGHDVAIFLRQAGINAEEFAQYEREILKMARAEVMEKLGEGFPPRTESMVKTLLTAHEWHKNGKFKGKFILMTGLRHVDEFKDDSRYSLTPLYNILDTLPVIIICPTIKSPVKQQGEI